MAQVSNSLNGIEFIIKESDPSSIYIPNDFTEEQLMILDMVRSFIEDEVRPLNARLEKQEPGLTTSLLEQLGELGLLGAHMPEKFGGMALDTNTNTIISEQMGGGSGFSVSFAAHTGIGMLPILYFGTKEQKEKYLPKLITGELKASYCLTEPNSGSDALAAKTKAILSEDGKHYILNGQKMWITNAGFADVFTLFAKIDGELFSCFILEKGMEGLTLGEEEKKLGIKSSSTRMVFLENVKVPVENLLGKEGKGAKIAFNVLNTGRYKIGPMCLGGSKHINTLSIKYANEREQFGTDIANFGAIKYKLAEQAIKSFATESAVYRTSNLIQEKIIELKKEGLANSKAKLGAAEEYALESSILKIASSESLSYSVDEGVQIYGGMGYSEEMPMAQAYRDSRINRIFEGTNEINRLLMVNMVMKKAMKGKLDFVTPAKEIQKEILDGVKPKKAKDEAYGEEKLAIINMKKVLIMVLGSVAKQAMAGKINLKVEQEILMNIADIITAIYLTESTSLRVQKLATLDNKNLDQSIYDAILRTLVHDSQYQIGTYAIDAIASFVKPKLHKTFMKGIRRYSSYPLQNVKENRRMIARVLIDANEYCL